MGGGDEKTWSQVAIMEMVKEKTWILVAFMIETKKTNLGRVLKKIEL